MRLGLFRRSAQRKPEPEVVQRVKVWVMACLELAPETPVAVNEIVCRDPSCPGVETVMLVMRPGDKTRAYKVPKAIEDVTEQDVREALV